MKEIVAIIRPRKVGPTRDRLAELGFPCMTAVAVLGRGQQRGIAGEVGGDLSSTAAATVQSSMRYVPKRLLTIVVSDDDADDVVNAIIAVNRTGQIGDGKIFVSAIADMLRVRTNERGNNAIA